MTTTRKLWWKVTAVITAVAMICAMSNVFAFASDETSEDESYHYVALGDSVPAGNGLPSAPALDTNYWFMDYVSEYGVEGAYPMLFGSILQDELQDSGYEVTASNLGQCGWGSSDLVKALQGDTTMSSYLQLSFGTYATNAQERLDKNVDILNTNLADADLVSVEFGFNDVATSIVTPLLEDSDNALFEVFRRAFMAISNGYEPNYQKLLTLLQESDITEEDVTELVEYMASLPSTMQSSSNQMVSNTQTIVDEVEQRNPDAQIALISTYSPYGNSTTCDGVTYDSARVAQEIAQAIVEVYCPDAGITISDASDIEAAAAQLEGMDADTVILQMVTELVTLTETFDEAEATGDTVDTTKIEELIDNISTRLSYFISYETLGKISYPYLQSMNSGLQEIAANDSKVTYVDIWNVPNENNLDPHPGEAGHSAIANFMKDALLPQILPEKGSTEEETNETADQISDAVDNQGQSGAATTYANTSSSSATPETGDASLGFVAGIIVLALAAAAAIGIARRREQR